MVKLDFASPLWRANFELVHPDDRELLICYTYPVLDWSQMLNS